MQPDAGLSCSFATSGGGFRCEMPVGSFADDVNVAGIHDLAGSVAEFVSDPINPVDGFSAYCGGTYNDADPSRFATVAPARGLQHGTASPGVGIRLALDLSRLGDGLPEK